MSHLVKICSDENVLKSAEKKNVSLYIEKQIVY